MGLEAPLALLGLAAALLPVIIHRIRTRDLNRKPWPALALLQRAAAAQKRKRSLADLMLLLMRIAFLALQDPRF